MTLIKLECVVDVLFDIYDNNYNSDKSKKKNNMLKLK